MFFDVKGRIENSFNKNLFNSKDLGIKKVKSTRRQTSGSFWIEILKIYLIDRYVPNFKICKN